MADRAVGLPIAREGVPFVLVGGIPAMVAGLIGWGGPSILLGALTCYTAWFFRNPHRVIPPGDDLVVSPGDGRVIAVQEEFEPKFLKEQSIRVSVFLNIFNVHINRIPCSGTIQDVAYQPGQFFGGQPARCFCPERTKFIDDSANRREESVMCSSRRLDRPPHRMLELSWRACGQRRSIWVNSVRVKNGPLSSRGKRNSCEGWGGG